MNVSQTIASITPTAAEKKAILAAQDKARTINDISQNWRGQGGAPYGTYYKPHAEVDEAEATLAANPTAENVRALLDAKARSKVADEAHEHVRRACRSALAEVAESVRDIGVNICKRAESALAEEIAKGRAALQAAGLAEELLVFNNRAAAAEAAMQGELHEVSKGDALGWLIRNIAI